MSGVLNVISCSKGRAPCICSVILDDAIGEKYPRAIGFFRLRTPLVADGRTVWLQCERAGYTGCRGIGSLQLRGAMRCPASGRRRNLELFVPNSLAVKLNGEFSLVRSEEPCLLLRLRSEGAQS